MFLYTNQTIFKCNNQSIFTCQYLCIKVGEVIAHLKSFPFSDFLICFNPLSSWQLHYAYTYIVYDIQWFIRSIIFIWSRWVYLMIYNTLSVSQPSCVVSKVAIPSQDPVDKGDCPSVIQRLLCHITHMKHLYYTGTH
jgi:hypothetical protein